MKTTASGWAGAAGPRQEAGTAAAGKLVRGAGTGRVRADDGEPPGGAGRVAVSSAGPDPPCGGTAARAPCAGGTTGEGV